ncbi:hypothetical protein ACFC0M_18165 [Streptomyces sp. NPDC056149]|uniref:hypothetical protein n=1 Tax=Streptomyces sp. NPDC056149 TaxID=3345728 RepID=UPI0035E29546
MELPRDAGEEHHGRVALLGDAVHPMTLNLGQGGCQPSRTPSSSPTRPPRTPRWRPRRPPHTWQRLPRTMEVVRRSGRIGRLTTWRSRPACALRAALIAATARLAADLALRGPDGIADRRPPTAP